MQTKHVPSSTQKVQVALQCHALRMLSQVSVQGTLCQVTGFRHRMRARIIQALLRRSFACIVLCDFYQDLQTQMRTRKKTAIKASVDF